LTSILNNNYLFIDKLFKTTYYFFFLAFSPYRSAGNYIQMPFNIDYNESFLNGYGPYCLNIPQNDNFYNCEGLSIINTINKDKNTFKNSLFCDNDYVKMNLPFDTHQNSQFFLDENRMYSNKFYIYDVNGTITNKKYLSCCHPRYVRIREATFFLLTMGNF
jgi:hypothetical protein